MTELGLPLRHRKMINRISLELPAEQSRDRQEKDPSPLHVHSTAPNPPFASILPPPPLSVSFFQCHPLTVATPAGADVLASLV